MKVSLRWSAAVLMVSMLSSALAEAEPPAKKSSKKATPGKAATSRTAAPAAPDAPAAAAPSAASKDRKGPAKYDNTPKLEDAAKEALTDQKRDEAIDRLKPLVRKIEDGSPQKPELLYQLSELYWEKSKYLARKEELRYEASYRQYEEAKNRGEKVPEPKRDNRESELYRSETMGLYDVILRDYPQYERKDEVLFSLGYNLYELNKKEQAIKRYQELIKFYPQSKFVPDTYVQLANHYFDVANNLVKAKEMYEKALATKVPKIYSYSLYKLAWCDFNAGDHPAALKKLQSVVEYAESRGKDMVDLKNEALNDMVTVFVQLDQADEAIAYYKQKTSPKRQLRLLSKLAYQLADAGHHENAIKVFRKLIDDQPNAPPAPEFQQAIVKSFEGLRQRENVKAEIKRLVELYRPGSAWWTGNEAQRDVLRNAFNVTEEAMRTMVTEYHQEAQKTKQVETYRLARDIYKQYIDAFATSQDESFVSDFAFNLKFYYAEILWALEEWEAAAVQYEEVVAFKVPNRDSAKEVSENKYRQSAAYTTILAYEKLLKIERGLLTKTDLKEGQKVDEQKKKGNVEKGQRITKRSAKELQEQKLTPRELKLIAACDRYNQLFPDNRDEIDVRYQAAVVYYDRNHFVEAAKRFGEIILKWPEEKRSQDAADLSMSVLEEKEEWLELNKLSRQFLANKKLSRPGSEFTKRAMGVVEGSQYKWVDEVIYKKDKNPERAADEFLKFVSEFPGSNNSDRALTYAMIIFQDASQLDRGIATGERILKEYPRTPFEMKVRYTLAHFYEKIADFQKSAEMYESFIAAYDAAAKTKGPKNAGPAVGRGATVDSTESAALLAEAEKWVPDAQFNAALWYEGLGKSQKAITAYEAYMARFKDKKDVPDIFFNIGLIYEKDKRWTEALKHFETFNRQFASDKRATPTQHYLAQYRQFLAQQKLKNAKEQDKLQDELIKNYTRLGPTEKKDDAIIQAYAHARFSSLTPLWNSYTDIKFNRIGTLKRDLALKLKKIQEVEKAYTDVLGVGAGEYGIAALTRIGLAYADFAQNFLDSPNPPRLSQDQLDMYRSELENRAFPLEEKAIEALEKALAKSYELNIYNEWTLTAQDKINKYRPGLYAKMRDVSYQGSEFFATSPVEKALGESPKSAQSEPATVVMLPADAKTSTTSQKAP